MADETIAGPGHNSVIEISEEKYHAYVGRHADLEEQAQIIAKKKKNLRKQMRADGIRLTEFDAASKLAELKRDDVDDHFRHLQQYLRWNRVPIGEQFELNIPEAAGGFEDEAAILARATATATQDGFWAGIRNRPMGENPHDDNTDAGQAWIKAWHDGQARRNAESLDPLDDDGE